MPKLRIQSSSLARLAQTFALYKALRLRRQHNVKVETIFNHSQESRSSVEERTSRRATAQLGQCDRSLCELPIDYRHSRCDPFARAERRACNPAALCMRVRCARYRFNFGLRIFSRETRRTAKDATEEKHWQGARF